MMEKTGDLGSHTPQPGRPAEPKQNSSCCGGSCKQPPPLTKEGADRLEKSLPNTAADAVAKRSKENG